MECRREIIWKNAGEKISEMCQMGHVFIASAISQIGEGVAIKCSIGVK